MIAQSTLISYHTEAFVKTEVACTALLLVRIEGGPFAPSEVRTHDHQMPTNNPKRYVITATFLYYKHQIFAILWVTKMLIEAKA